jgi:hypothetical protein
VTTLELEQDAPAQVQPPDEPGDGFRPFAGCRRCRLTTEERPGRAVHTRVRCAFADGRLYLRAKPADEWPRHIWDHPFVHVAPCTRSGRPLAAPTPARGRILPAGESERALGLWPRSGRDELCVELVPLATA